MGNQADKSTNQIFFMKIFIQIKTIYGFIQSHQAYFSKKKFG